MLGRLICFALRKHKRGKFLRVVDGVAKDGTPTKRNVFACPRCGFKRLYKV